MYNLRLGTAFSLLFKMDLEEEKKPKEINTYIPYAMFVHQARRFYALQ